MPCPPEPEHDLQDALSAALKRGAADNETNVMSLNIEDVRELIAVYEARDSMSEEVSSLRVALISIRDRCEKIIKA